MDLETIVNQIDTVLGKTSELTQKSRYKDCSDLPLADTVEVVTQLFATIDRFALPGSEYRKKTDMLNRNDSHHNIKVLSGVLKALKSDYQAGYLQTFQELIHADIFGDFLEMADYLLKEGYKDPAAVLIGGVLEEHLRKICTKDGIPITSGSKPKKTDTLNTELYTSTVYSKLDYKNILAWLDLRNKAAHGNYSDYTDAQVSLMLQGVGDFISRFPA